MKLKVKTSRPVFCLSCSSCLWLAPMCCVPAHGWWLYAGLTPMGAIERECSWWVRSVVLRSCRCVACVLVFPLVVPFRQVCGPPFPSLSSCVRS